MKKFKKLLLAVAMVAFTLSLSLFAISCTSTVEISFNVNGGTAIEAVKVEKETEYTLPVPERTGYSFEGWYLTEDFSGEPVTAVTASEDATYYAKWEQLYAVNLNANGGTLSESKIYLKQGEVVYDYVSEYTPTKNNVVFGAWFNGETELAKNYRMPTNEITLTAKYKVEYTIELWGEKIEGNGYEKVADDIKGYEYAGVEFKSEQRLTGFKEINHENTVTSLTISETASQNVFKHYFNRETFTVSFNSNYPVELANESTTHTVKYGQEVEIPSNYELDGYCLIGWATSASGDVVYPVDYISSVLYGNTTEEGEVETFIPERNTTLYAVWNKGYVDMFNSGDYIFLLDAESEVIYLNRGGVFFEGSYKATTGKFTFENEHDVFIEGYLNSNGTYTYYSANRNDMSASLYRVGEGIINTTNVYFDAYNGIVYSVTTDGKSVESEGTYLIDEDGNYVVTFTEGELAGQTVYLMMATATINDVETPVFLLRNEEEYNMGEIVRLGIYEGDLVSYRSPYYTITLDGYGYAIYSTDAETKTTYYYTLEEDKLTLISSSGSVAAVAYLSDFNGSKAYSLYTESSDVEYKVSDTEYLQLDGMYNATYVNGNTTVQGYYVSTTESVFSDADDTILLITVVSGNATRIYMVTEHTEVVSTGEFDENGVEITEEKVTYTIQEKPATYAEYYHLGDGSTYYAPLIVIDENEVGVASVYARTNTGVYVKYAEGEYTYNETTGLYSMNFDKVETLEEGVEIFVEPVDLRTVASVTFALDTENTNYSINYWHSYTDNEGTSIDKTTVYTGTKGEKLTVVAGMAIYSANGATVIGKITVTETVSRITLSEGYIYLEINEEEKTFLTYDNAPYDAVALNANGTINSNVTLSNNGKGGATYSVVEGETTTTYEGTFTLTTKTTTFGVPVYKFESTDYSVEFILLYTSSAVYFAPYNPDYNGEYVSDINGVLEIDGYGYWAKYTNENGESFEAMYMIAEENVIVMMLEDGYYYFDIDGSSFTKRGDEYGTYIVFDNQSTPGTYVHLDGYGNAQVYEYEEGEDGESELVFIDENATYVIDGNSFTISYTLNSQAVTMVGELGVYTYNTTTYNIFIISHKEVVTTLINDKDWSVLILDDLGNATMYDADGVVDNGSYTLITDSLLYYVNETASDACIYVYDLAEGTAEQIRFTARAYYTTELESLLFSQYGFAIFNGETRYYYNVVNGEVIIYHQDATNEKANEYGFVEENFGRFTNEKVWDGKNYFANNGYDIVFKRDTATADYYPVPVSQTESKPLENLQFTPSGNAEFTVSGSVTIDGRSYPVTVTREYDEETGEYVLRLANGNFIFYVTVEYNGESESGESLSTYEVVGMEYRSLVYSDTYLSMAYIYAMFFGQNIGNTYGAMYFVSVYDTLGEITDNYCVATFGESSGLYDLNGELLSTESAEYVYDENLNIYIVTYEAADGYTYNLYVQVAQNKYFTSYLGYTILAATRVQEIVVDENYTVVTETVISSSYYQAGDLFSIGLKYNGELLEYDVVLIENGVYYYVVRTFNEDGKITSTTYYEIKLTLDVKEDFGGIEGEEGEEGEEESSVVIVPLYKSATVSVETITTYYASESENYVDESATDGITLIYYDGELYIVTESVYDAESTTYTVTTSEGSKFTVKKSGSAVVITKVVEETEETENA